MQPFRGHMSIEHSIRHYLAAHVLRGRDEAALDLDFPLLDEKVLDSMDVQRLVGFVEDEFGVRVTDDFLSPEHFASIRAIARMVAMLRGEA